MQLSYYFGFVLLSSLASSAVTAARVFPRETSAFNGTSSAPPSTSSAMPTPTSILCCQVEAWNIPIQVWYSESIEVTVATVYTTYIVSNNITISTIESTLSANYTPTTTGFGGQNYDTLSLPGIPTDIVQGNNLDFYPGPFTFLEYGTAFTDPYGVVVPSPTPVVDYSVGIFTWDASTSYLEDNSGGTTVLCPSQNPFLIQAYVPMADIYPSGFYLADPGLDYNFYADDQLAPAQLTDFMLSNLPPASAGYPTWYSQIASGSCQPGSVGGQPTAHIPVNQLTVDGGAVTVTQAVPTSTTTPPSSTTSSSTGSSGSGSGGSGQGSGNQGDGGSSSTTQGDGGVGTGSTSQGQGDSSSPSQTGGGGASPNGGGSPPAAPSSGDQFEVASPTGRPQPTNQAPPPTVVVGGSTLTGTAASSYIQASGLGNGAGIVVSGSTLTGTAASAYIIANAEGKGGGMALTVGTNVIQYDTNAASDIIIGSQTLSPGAQITVSGEVLSLAPDGGSVVVLSNGAPVTTEPVGMDLTAGTDLVPYSTDAASDIIVGTQTLSPGAKITVSGGDVLSLASGGSVVVYSSGVAVTTEGLGGAKTLAAPQPSGMHSGALGMEPGFRNVRKWGVLALCIGWWIVANNLF